MKKIVIALVIFVAATAYTQQQYWQVQITPSIDGPIRGLMCPGITLGRMNCYLVYRDHPGLGTDILIALANDIYDTGPDRYKTRIKFGDEKVQIIDISYNAEQNCLFIDKKYVPAFTQKLKNNTRFMIEAYILGFGYVTHEFNITGFSTELGRK